MNDLEDSQTDEKSEKTEEKEHTTYQGSGVSRPTIGETTISSKQAERIQGEVHSALQEVFPGIAQTGTHSVPFNRGSETGHLGTTSAAVIDLSGHSQRPELEAIAGSEVSMANTESRNETGEKQNSFARMMRSTGAVNPGQT